jgi:hypothetical protein
MGLVEQHQVPEVDRFLMVQLKRGAEFLNHGGGQVALAIDHRLQEGRGLDSRFQGKIPIGKLPYPFFLFLVIMVKEFAVVNIFENRLHTVNIAEILKNATRFLEFSEFSCSICVQKFL